MRKEKYRPLEMHNLIFPSILQFAVFVLKQLEVPPWYKIWILNLILQEVGGGEEKEQLTL